MIGLVMHWAWFLLTVLVFTAGEILASPQQMSFIADWAPPEARGRYLSLYQATWSVAFAVNPAITLPLPRRPRRARVLGPDADRGAARRARAAALDRTADRPEGYGDCRRLRRPRSNRPDCSINSFRNG